MCVGVYYMCMSAPRMLNFLGLMSQTIVSHQCGYLEVETEYSGSTLYNYTISAALVSAFWLGN